MMKIKSIVAVIAALAVMAAVPAAAQFTANALPTGVALPGFWEDAQIINGQIPVGSGPIYWTVQLDHRVTFEAADDLYTYWYRVQFLSADPTGNVLKTSSVVLDTDVVATDTISGLRWHGQYYNNGVGTPGLIADPDYSTTTLSWQKPVGSQFGAGDTIVMWYRSIYPSATQVPILLQDTGQGYGHVPVPTPEPMTMAMAGFGLSAVAALRRRAR